MVPRNHAISSSRGSSWSRDVVSPALVGGFFTPSVTWEALATHSNTLAWKIPRTEEPGGLQSTGSQRAGHDWVTSLSVAPGKPKTWHSQINIKKKKESFKSQAYFARRNLKNHLISPLYSTDGEMRLRQGKGPVHGHQLHRVSQLWIWSQELLSLLTTPPLIFYKICFLEV